MDRDLARRIEGLLRAPVAHWEPRRAPWQPQRGANERYAVVLGDGRRAFVKHTVVPALADWLRREHEVYSAVRAPYMPELFAWDDGEGPLLIIEDLTDADWPPPWTADRVEAVLATLADVAATPLPGVLPSVSAYNDLSGCWEEVGVQPEPFLSLGLVDARWLDRALPALVAAARSASMDGRSLVHFDVRSDNLAIRDGRAVLFDWSHACVGDPRIDLAGWLPSLAAEGGPQPHELMPGEPGYAALIAGYFASRAGLPPPATAPTVRAVQLAQLVPALAWARRELDL